MAARPRRAERMPPDERRAAIVEATLPLLHEHGNRVTVRLIAEAAGVAEGTIFTVFPDKDALICAATDRAFDPGPGIRALQGIDPGLPLRERLVATVDILADGVRRTFGLISALGLTKPPDGSLRAEQRRRLNAGLVAAIAAVLEPHADELVVAPEELARIVRLLTFSSAHPLLNDGRPLTSEQIVGVLLDGSVRPQLVGASATIPTHHDHRGN